MRRTYFVVEGPHDVEAVGRMLRRRGFTRVQKLDQLDEQWRNIIPRRFPAEDLDILKRVPVPVFFQKGNHTVAVHSAVGVEKIVKTYRVTRLNVEIDSVGFVVDADSDAESRRESLQNSLSQLSLDEPERPMPQAEVYVLPNNSVSGTLEDLLMRCGDIVYPTLMDRAKSFVEGIDPKDNKIFAQGESKELLSPSGKSKAILGCVANVLRPGKSIQVSIQDNRWLKDEPVFQDPWVMEFQSFIHRVIGYSGEDDL